MHRSKAKATPAEIAEIESLHKSLTAPMIAIHLGPPLAKSGWKRLYDRLDEMARAHGLEDQGGEWGFDAKTGEFLSQFPIVEVREVANNA